MAAAKKPAKKVVKKAVQKSPAKTSAGTVVRKPARKSPEKAGKLAPTRNKEMATRLKEAEKLMKRMRDAGVPAGESGHPAYHNPGHPAYHNPGQNHSHRILFSEGELTVIHVLKPSGSQNNYSTAVYDPNGVNLLGSTVVSPTYYTLPDLGDEVAVTHIKAGGHMQVLTGDAAMNHAHQVLCRFQRG